MHVSMLAMLEGVLLFVYVSPAKTGWEEWKTVEEFLQQLTTTFIVPEQRVNEVKEKIEKKVSAGQWPKN